MPRQRPVVPPPYRLPKAGAQAFTIVDARHVYLGRHGTPARREKHPRVVREAAGGPAAAVLAAFWGYAKSLYP